MDRKAMKRICEKLTFVFLCLLFHMGCVTTTTHQPSKATQAPQRVSTESETDSPTKAPLGIPKQEEPSDSAEKTASLPAEEPDEPMVAREAPQTNQELLDSALDFYQAASDFWEEGDLENAMDALDKAYSLILRVATDDNPDLQQQKEDLRITIAKRIIEVYTSRFTVANGDYKAIPLDKNKHVDKALRLFKGPEKKFFTEAYRRSGIYRPMIVKALKTAGLPEELSWLPLIESGFKVRALSRARALGLWQFIASTGYKYGLKRDRWIDERMDPEKSTHAAIAYLKELHQIFGDWTTVLAAYNCGERRVLNRIRTQKISHLDNFWDLYRRLPRETAFYVPKFLAVLHILNNPEAHGFSPPPVQTAIETEEVAVNKQVHLKTIAKHLDVEYGLLRDLNPELRQYLTPKDPYLLNVPMGKGRTLLAKLSAIPAYRPPVPSYVIHRVRKGETLSVIATRYKTSIRSIMAMNNLKRRNYLRVGWRLKVPAGRRYVPKGKGGTVQSGKKSTRLTRYKVRKGDSLWTIARRFNTTTKTIQSFNGLRTTRLQIGQVLSIPSGTIRNIKSGKTMKYKVRKGDSPYLIARRYQMNLAEFLKLNKLTPRKKIYPGQILLVYAE